MATYYSAHLQSFKEEVYEKLKVPPTGKLKATEEALNSLFHAKIKPETIVQNANNFVKQWMIKNPNQTLKQGFKAISLVDQKKNIEDLAKLTIKESVSNKNNNNAQSVRGAVSALAGEAFEAFLEKAFQDENITQKFINDTLDEQLLKSNTNVTFKKVGSTDTYSLPKDLVERYSTPGDGQLQLEGTATLGKADVTYQIYLTQQDGSVSTILGGISAKNILKSSQISLLSSTSIHNMLQPWYNFSGGEKAVAEYLNWLRQKGTYSQDAHSIVGMMALGGRKYINTATNEVEPNIGMLAIFNQSNKEKPIKLIATNSIMEKIKDRPNEILSNFNFNIDKKKDIYQQLKTIKKSINLRAKVVRSLLYDDTF